MDIINYSNYIKENVDEEFKLTKKAILFADLVHSATKWKMDSAKMLRTISNISTIIENKISAYNGVVIKTIGDAYMISFESLLDSIKFGIYIQEYFKNTPTFFYNYQLIFRIGICYGDVFEISNIIQDCNLIDYLGNTVNTAARIESVVAENGHLAFGTTDNEIDEEIEKLLSSYELENITYTNKDERNVRSYRLLSDVQKNVIKDIEELKGVNDINVIKIKV